MDYTAEQLAGLDRITNLKLINSITGIKPANLIGTVDADGKTNLAIFSSVVHLGSRPPLLGMIARPQTDEVGHTLDNIRTNGEYTINHIGPSFNEKAHYTSAKFERGESEFERCGLTPEFVEGIKAPFVAESEIKMALRFKEIIPIEFNGTSLVIGEIIWIRLPVAFWVDGDVDLEKSQSMGISGLNTYYSLKKEDWFPYARKEETPDFQK